MNEIAWRKKRFSNHNTITLNTHCTLCIERFYHHAMESFVFFSFFLPFQLYFWMWLAWTFLIANAMTRSRMKNTFFFSILKCLHCLIVVYLPEPNIRICIEFPIDIRRSHHYYYNCYSVVFTHRIVRCTSILLHIVWWADLFQVWSFQWIFDSFYNKKL